MICQFVFNVWESKAFIAKRIVHHPLVQEFLTDGIITLARGTTNAFILKELLEITNNSSFEVDVNNYCAGVVDGSLWVSDTETRTPEISFFKGEPKFIPVNEVVKSTDLVIKGANAIGTDWIAGVLCGHPQGGTIGKFYPTAVSRGIPILVPVSTGKMIPFSMRSIMPHLKGQKHVDYARGMPTGVFPILGGEIFSELEAIQTFGEELSVFPLGAGGVYNGAGATIFEVSGSTDQVKQIIQIYEEIKNTEPLKINLKAH